MIILKFSAGLGNQLYEYAMLRYLQRQYGAENIKADITDYRGVNYHNGFELIRIFGDTLEEKLHLASNWDVLRYTGQIPYISTKCFRIVLYVNRFLKKIKPVDRIVEEEILGSGCNIVEMSEQLKKLDISRNYELAGYWILPDYYDTYFEDIITELRFPDFNSQENIKTAEKIKHTNSVSVHIRRGDYVGTKYDILTEEYYGKAMKYISEWMSDITWFFFSDDVDYVEEKYAHIGRKYIISHNKGENSFRDMQLMSMCKHNIIANSTFSEWGAIFNKNTERIVIYPKWYEKGRENRDKKWVGWIKL